MWPQSESSSSSKLSLKERVADWKARHPRRFWAVAAILAVLTLLLIGWVFVSTRTFKKAIAYEPCQIDYGETVSSWDGRAGDAWNETGYHYETKRFKLTSLAPGQLFPKVAESPLNTVTTSNLDGSSGCQANFNGLVDTNADTYKWYGARSQAARLGTPAIKEVNNEGRANSKDIDAGPAKSLRPPVFGSSHQRAAAWVDDGAQAVLQSQDRARTQLLWCQGFNRPLGGNGNCKSLAEPPVGKLPLRGAGYLFTADNCPLGSKCDGVDRWYNKDATQKDTDYSNLIGKNERGELVPFYLHLSAVSTYANTMGSWMNITFKYPTKPEITNQISTVPKTIQPGGTFEIKLAVSKIGPNLNSLAAGVSLAGQPLKELSGFNATGETMDAINRGEQTVLAAKYQLSGGEAGKCYDLPISLSAVVAAPNPDPKKANEAYRVDVAQPATARFCIAAPAAVATYTYEVNSRGAIQSDLNDFARQVAETYGAAQGWTKAGASFRRVESGGNFTVVLASPDQMTTFSSGCDAVYSCNAGRYVIINDERWRTATPSWNNAGASLRDYHHMVVNHETGHWLGFGHLQCPAAGAPAPVMQQQSISLQGCTFNPWPTQAEIDTLKARL